MIAIETNIRVRATGLLLVALLTTIGAPAAAAHAPTIVSLTFDDGERQTDAIRLLEDTGLPATFYVNSNLIRRSGASDRTDYLTKTELDRLCDDCDEYSVRRDTLVRFLFWLKGRAARGNQVRTVHQVVAGNPH